MNSEEDKLAFEILNQLEYSQERESVNLARLFDSLFLAYSDDSKKKILKIDVDLNYNGLRLGENFEEGDFLAMFRDFKNNRKLHAKYAIKIFDEVIRLLAKLPNIQEITLFGDDECVIVGDLHGHFDDLAKVIMRLNIPGKLYYFVFNGDWVDRGENQIEVLLTIFYAFILYPKRVILNRGNHEDFTQNSHLAYQPCLKQVSDDYFGQFGSIVYQKLDELFRYLPLACIINNPMQEKRLFVVHGGISKELDLDVIKKLDRTKYSSVCKFSLDKDSLEYKHAIDVQDMLWSDPYPSDEEDREGISFNEFRNIGKNFGANITKIFLKKHNLTEIIRSHECKNEGYKVAHGGKLITVFSASNYNQENQACVLKISTSKKKFEVLVYASKAGDRRASTYEIDKLTKAIRKLRMHLYKLKPALLNEFQALDPKHTGMVTIDELVDVLKKHFPNIPFREIKDRICECDDDENKAKYESLFASVTLYSKYNAPECIAHNYEILQTIFEKIDKDSSGYITPNEFQDACAHTLEHLGIKFSSAEISGFLKAIDSNNDGLIDLQEFKKAFSITLQD